jgi:hypothetical protein
MNKKAQGLSMNVIIIAAISLLVLIVLIVLVLRANRGIVSGTECTSNGQCWSGDCSDLEVTPGESWNHDSSRDGKNGGCAVGEICCMRTLKAPAQ